MAPGLVMLAALLAVVMSYRTYFALRQDTDAQLALFSARDQRLSSLRMNMVKSDLALFRTITWRSIGVNKEIFLSLRQSAEERLDGVNVLAEAFLQGAALGPEEQSLLEAVHRISGRYETAARDVLDMLDTDTGMALTLLSEAERRFADADAAIGNWEIYHLDARRALEDNAAKELDRAIALIALAVGAAFALAAVVSLLLSRAISDGVQGVTRVMGRLAAGDKMVAVPQTDRDDEVGAMIRAVAVFKENAQTLDRLAEERAALEEKNRIVLQRQVEKLAVSEQRFRDIAESSADWFWETDAHGRLTMMSERFYTVTGLKKNQVIGRSRLDFVMAARSQEDAAQWVTYAKDVAQRKPFRRLDYRVQRPDGRVIFIRSNGKPFFAEDGTFLGYRGASSNVTALIKAEQEIEDNRRRLLGVTSNLFESVVLVASDGTILFANPSAHHLLGVDDLVGMSLDAVMCFAVAGKDVSFLEGPPQNALAGADVYVDDDAQVWLPVAEKRMYVAYACAALTEENGDRAVVISFRCIDALKAAQREALQSSRLATVGQLAAGIAHEINTPIQYIGDNLRFFDTSIAAVAATYATIRSSLAAESTPPELTAYIEDVIEKADIPYLLEELPAAVRQSLDGVEHVAKIVRSMKEFSHPGSTAKVMTDINRAVESTLVVTTNEWKHTAFVEKDLDPDVPAILCFPADINQVLLNLIVNASHALEGREEKGSIRVSTRCDGDSVEILIADNGPGVPKDMRERVFDPFFTTKPVGKGTGQGLAISLDVVANKHGGRLTVEETPGGGATFVVRLPIGVAAVSPEGEDNTV
ncbi:MAG: PAS domain S-box protein [Rhodospirillaceae bacterium]|nr:PAS domain S-box protein [Rhodospirillaceae bacterium]